MLIHETGEGLPNSNSYATVEEADAYFEARQVQLWIEADDAAKAPALIRATDFIDVAYVFKSVRSTDAQALENPRCDEDELNPKLVRATIELALLALTQDLFAVPARDVVQETTSVGRVSTSKTYDASASLDPFEHITRILSPIARRRSASVSSTRLVTR